MKTDPQHLLPEHLAFYKGRKFWIIVVALVFVINDIYIILKYGFSLETVLLPNIMIPALLFGGITSSEILSLSLSIILYGVLLYFSLFRTKIKFWLLGTLLIFMIWSTYVLSIFPGGFN